MASYNRQHDDISAYKETWFLSQIKYDEESAYMGEATQIVATLGSKESRKNW